MSQGARLVSYTLLSLDIPAAVDFLPALDVGIGEFIGLGRVHCDGHEALLREFGFHFRRSWNVAASGTKLRAADPAP